MNMENLIYFLGGIAIILILHRFTRKAFIIGTILIFGLAGWIYYSTMEIPSLLSHILWVSCPLLLINIVVYTFLGKEGKSPVRNKYFLEIKTKGQTITIENIKRGVSIIGSAGSGKTESVVYKILEHFGKNDFSGIIHDYKNLELTEVAYPLFKESNLDFYIVSFDKFYNKVNPIAPHYMETEEDVNEISRVLTENLLELKDSNPTGSGKFFNDVVEGLFGGLIWKLKTDYPECCTLPHLIAIYQFLDTESMVDFLSDNITSKSMADAYIKGVASEKQTAGVNSTLSNALKRLATKRIFYVLSGDNIALDINNIKNKAVVSVVNNPKYDSSYSPVIASIIHTMTKQISVRKRESSFLMMEEASTLRLLNMQRIPATMRSYDISTIYVIQDKVQNDIMYGDKGSKAILSNLSYQFFGKANDPDTAKYYEQFFEIVKRKTKSISSGNTLNYDSRVTVGEKEQSKVRADVFFKLKPGEFVVYSDGFEKKVQFKLEDIKRELPQLAKQPTSKDLEDNFNRIHMEAQAIFKVSV